MVDQDGIIERKEDRIIRLEKLLAGFTPAFASGDKPFLGSFRNTLPLKLGNGCKDVEDETSGWRGGVDAFSQGPAPWSRIASTMLKRSCSDRLSRSYLATTTTSPSRSCSIMRSSSGRAFFVPEIFSEKMRSAPVALGRRSVHPDAALLSRPVRSQ
jgi:hypothetical protein